MGEARAAGAALRARAAPGVAAGGVGAPAGPHESCCLLLQDVFGNHACTTACQVCDLQHLYVVSIARCVQLHSTTNRFCRFPLPVQLYSNTLQPHRHRLCFCFCRHQLHLHRLCFCFRGYQLHRHRFRFCFRRVAVNFIFIDFASASVTINFIFIDVASASHALML